MSKKPALGKGLSALIPSRDDQEKAAEGVLLCPVERIRPNPNQPRKRFDPEALEALSRTIREKGVLQPLLVRAHGDEYELIAGERRLRAARLAGLAEVPVLVREAEPSDSLEISILENIQREDLNPIEEARAYRDMVDRLEITQDELARRVGKDRSSVTNALRLLQLPREIQEDLASGELSAGHARAILGIEHDVQRLKVRALIKQKGLSVRATEKLVQQMREGGAGRSRSSQDPDPDLQALQDDLGRHLGTRVRIQQGRKGGKIQILFSSADELDRLCELMRNL